MTTMTWTDAFAWLMAPGNSDPADLPANTEKKADKLTALSEKMPGGRVAANQVRRALARWQATKAGWTIQARQDLIKAGEKLDRATYALRSRGAQPVIEPQAMSRVLVYQLLRPKFVRREFNAYLDCGLIEKGAIRLRCSFCGFDRLVAFSCCAQQETMWSAPSAPGGNPLKTRGRRRRR